MDFFGDQEYGVRILSDHPVVKVQGLKYYEYTDFVPETIREARKN